jgi:tetratricopeptide (TPR) repeat protein
MPDRLKPCLLVVFAALLPYVSSLRYGFVYDDDVQVLGNPAILDWHFVPAYFLKPIAGFYSGIHSAHYYRPIFFLWLRLNYFLWGTHSWGWHLTNLTLHAGASLVVLVVLSTYFTDVRWATVGALIFAVHPAHVETVAWVSGCTDSLMALSLLGSLCLWMRNCETPSLLRRIGSLACCGLALLTKETAVILPVVIFFHAFLGVPTSTRTAERRNLSHGLREALPYVVLAAAYLAIRFFVLRGDAVPLQWISHTEALVTIPSLLVFYTRHLVWPSNLSIFYDFPIVKSSSSYLFWAPLALLCGALAVACSWFRRRRDTRIALAGLWFLLPLAPVLYIGAFKQEDFVHDRYLYLPVLTLSILAAMLGEFASQVEIRRGVSSFHLVVAGAAIVALALSTVAQVRPWENNLSLYTNAVRVAPKNGQARNNFANQYSALGRYQDASDVLKALVGDHPDLWLANYNYGFVNYRLGNFALAEEYLLRAIHLDPSEPDQYIYLGTTYFKEGRLPEAERQIRQGIWRKPDGIGYHIVLGVIEMQQGNLIGARDAMLEELRYHPESHAARVQLQAISPQLQTNN